MLLILIVSAIASTAMSCSCLSPKYRGNYTEAKSVVLATVVRLEYIANNPCHDILCLSRQTRAPQYYSYTLLLTAVFKGCGPRTEDFFARTRKRIADNRSCRVALRKGDTWLLFLGDPVQSIPKTAAYQNYYLKQCQVKWDPSSTEMIWWLQKNSKLPKNLCATSV